ncbi:hypothetical protein A1Q75_25705 [Klebsiella aerogenes]|uniref:prepilin-type N-terminal cleavage/methylation domain-containing protein n=1 Tax=Klebsiella aerogenes TaxID=548 RepID=UPI0007EA0EFC|nr:prepilin-type N-terminal cleavage/methylation domain-containing protein [Klebsiella aerogenes]OAZ18428.1 hypothetical protein AW170_26085 [Klebsiella aerogenes]OAZ18613.1 hypothetical protein A1Q75_25705 [Klebsiella aerogenes]OAZ18936.1 hypothetical protein A1J85_25615 [Klebsiella aerogenes]OAZ33775.1 hypothetical protein AYK88_26080 [Klebsiella aerogenes]OOL21090.1 hypothetical protein BXQ27_30340 [Klebsiella aerogenes]
MKGRRKGFSLIELLLVLVVATGIAGATFYGYSKLQEGFRTSNAIRDLATISKAMNAITASKPTIAEANSMLISSKSLPSTMVDTRTNTLVNANGLDDSYDVSFYNVPPSACSTLVSSGRVVYRNISNTTSGSKIAATSSMADITAFCSSFNTSSVLVFTNAD